MLFLSAILAKCHRAQGLDLLNDALRNFDSAGIFTIHGFCQRVLMRMHLKAGKRWTLKLSKTKMIYLRK